MDGGNSPNLRPLTLFERHWTWIYGLMPCAFIYLGMRTITNLLLLSNRDAFSFLLKLPTVVLPLPFVDFDLPLADLQIVLSRLLYPVAYFTWGRSTGHLLMGAYIVDRKTMRRMGPGRKLIRGLFQMAVSPIYPLVDLLSLGMILADREQRRSVNDWVAGTLVVTGDVPPAAEPYAWRSWLAALGNALRPLAPQPR